MKKIISSLLVATSLLFPIQTKMYAENETQQFEYEYEVLCGLGIISNDINYVWNKPITRGDFSVMVANMIGYDGISKVDNVFYDLEDEYYATDEINFLHNLMIVSGYEDGNFRAGKSITYGEATAILLRLMGINDYASAYNISHFPKKNKKNNSDILTFDMISGYVYEAMKTTVFDFASLSQGAYGYSNTDKTVLEKYRDISCVEGVVLTVGYKSLLDAGGNNAFQVGDLKLRVQDENLTDCLGYYSEVYYYSDNSKHDDEVIYAKAMNKYNEITVIDGEHASYNKGKIHYYEGDREKNISISPRAYMSNNYQPAYDTDKTTLFNINDGCIIINKISRSDIEVVMIESYKNYIVAGKSETNKCIYTLSGETINLENAEQFDIRDSAGNCLDIEDIAMNDIISVLTPNINYTPFVTVVVSRDIATGTVGSTYLNEAIYEITIDNVTYFTIKSFNTAYLPNVGESAEVYLNFRGRVVYTANKGSSSYRYGYLCRIKENKRDDDIIFRARIFGEDNIMHDYDAGKKIKIDNQTYKSYDAAETALLNGTGTSTIYQPIRFKLNADGILKEIDTEYRNIAANESAYSLTPVFKCYDKTRTKDTTINGSKKGELIYQKESGVFEGYVVPETNSKNFRVPAAYEGNDALYAANITFSTGGHSIDAYTSNPDKLTSDFIIQYSSLGAVADVTRIGVVTKVITTINEDNEIVYGITIASRANKDGKEYLTNEFCSFDNVPTKSNYHIFTHYDPKRGDAVIYSLNSQEELISIEPYYLAADRTWYMGSFVTDTYEGTWSGDNNFATNERFNMGLVYKTYGNVVTIALTDTKTVDSNTEKRTFMLGSDTKIYCIDKTGTVKTIKAEELIPYERNKINCHEIVIETFCNKPYIAVAYE